LRSSSSAEKLVFQGDKGNTSISKEKRKNRAEDVTYYRIPPTAVPSRISKLFGRVCIEYTALHASTYKHFYIYKPKIGTAEKREHVITGTQQNGRRGRDIRETMSQVEMPRNKKKKESHQIEGH